MKRPILVVAIGYIIGIIWGLYFDFSIALLYIFIAAIYFFLKIFLNHKSKFKLLSIRRYFRYVKLIFTKNVVFLIVIISIISNLIIMAKENYRVGMQQSIAKLNKIVLEAIIVQDRIDKDYKDTYKISTIINGKKVYFYLDVNKNKNKSFDYGDKIYLEGTYEIPETQRNYKGFDYNKYLKQKNILGIIKAENLILKSKEHGNPLLLFSNKISNKIEKKLKELLSYEVYPIVISLSVGNMDFIEEDIQEQFRNAGLLHVLAVSGTHMTYLILGTGMMFKNLFGKRKTYYLSIFIILFYILITGFSVSIIRSAIMGIVMLISKIVYRKNDIWTSMGLSLLIILFYNPYLILDLGMQFSYGGTIGIVLFQRDILKFLEEKMLNMQKNKFFINKLIKPIIEIISITISAQIIIIPIIIYSLNTLNIYFLISNIFVGVIIEPLTILCFILLISIFINNSLSTFIAYFVNMGIKILNFCAKIGDLPYSKIYFPTPNLSIVILSFAISFFVLMFFKNYYAKNKNATQIRLRNLVALFKYRIRQINRKFFIILFILSIFFMYVLKLIPSDLKVHFIDVGQGDATFIITPNNSTILIDGGGNLTSSFDVGENTLIPYILDRGFSSIDFVMISHFDYDHVGGILSLLENLEVKKIIISKQYEMTDNYEKFLEIVCNKNIDIILVGAGDKINIEKNLYFDILWPSKDFITENAINNNAIVAKMVYGKFNMLFTGDIEEIAEKEILKNYDKKVLNAVVLKVAHHGSKTSSTEEFLENVNPKIALIGVGKNNNFGHPSGEVLYRLQEHNVQLYRTDLNGEIIINIKENGYFSVNTCI